MNKKLYKLMNWAAIEEIIYSECDHPQDLLGPHAGGGGTLVQAYFPGASAVSIKWLSADPLIGTQCIQMEVADEDGYFAVILPEKKIFNYSYSVTYESLTGKKTIKKTTVEKGDPYRHSRIVSKEDIDSFRNGTKLDSYNMLGAHVMSHSGEKGVHFCVWAPNALRVSVIGDFNNWDGRINQMIRIDEDFFELFIPGDLAGCKFQYELKLKGDVIIKRNDPYSEIISDSASVISASSAYKWTDSAYMKARKNKPEIVLVYELNNSYFSGDAKKNKNEAEKLAKSVAERGYNYVQLSAQNFDSEMMSNCSYLYSVSSKISGANALKQIVDVFHNNGIGVIFNWNISGYGRMEGGLENFDGTALYEHMNPLQGFSADGNKKLFQYARPEVASFLLSNGFYWLKEFHADGICMTAVAQMLYLDYGKSEGNWIPNIYGGNENLEAIDLLKNFISSANNTFKGIVICAEDSSTHNGMTTPQSEGGFGFDYKWNEGFTGEFFDYMSYDPINRSSQHNKLVDEFVYAFAENFILPLSTDLVNGESVYSGFPGDENMKNNSLRLSLAFQYMHPGNKLISQDIDNEQTKLCNKLNELFLSEPALSKTNLSPESFEWLSNMRANECYISFVRKTDDPEDMIVAVANFAGIEQTITTGIPYEGKYIELINTDQSEFGGSNILNKGTICADSVSSDGRAQSITLKLAPLSMSILKFEPYTEEELVKVIEERIRRFTPVKKKK